MVNKLNNILDYFKNKVNIIPEEFLKAPILKYIVLKIRYGEFMNRILNNCRIIIYEDNFNKIEFDDNSFEFFQ
jgi:hypothetical protein